MWTDAHRYILVPDLRQTLAAEVAQAGHEVEKQIGLFKGTYLIEEEKEWLAKFDLAWPVYKKAIGDLFVMLNQGANKEALESMQEGHSVRNARNAIRVPLDNLLEMQIHESEELHETSSRHYTFIIYCNVAASLVSVVLSLLLGWFVARSITKPLARVVAIFDRMSDGLLDQEVLDEGRGDEIGQLIQSARTIASTIKAVVEDLQDMITAVEAGILSHRLEPERYKGEFFNLLKGINELTETISQPLAEVAAVMQKMAGGDINGRITGTYEGELRAMKSNVNRSLDTIGNLLDELGKMAENMAKGDLRINLAGNYQGDFAVLHTNMNMAIEELRKTLIEIDTSSQHIAIAAMQTSAAAGEVASQSENQLLMLTEVSTVVTQTAESVKEISISAEKGNVLACITANQSQEGHSQLKKLVEAVELIAASNAKVAQISERISKIADKTHILALNAGIEAARAGTHGLGFGIVAQQIGKLAEEASTAVTDIASLTVEASQNVSGGVAAAGETQSAIERIAQAASDNEQTVQMIASAITQQSTAVEQLSANAMELKARGENNAAAATEINATMESLSQMIQHTADQIGRFKLT
jgi:methyl-accepting chemotaxis protein